MFDKSYLADYLSFLSSYLPLISFLTPTIGGELGIIALSFLFSKTIKNFIIIVLFCFFGVLAIDSFWFFVAKSKYFRKLRNWKKISKNYRKLEMQIESISKGRDVIIIMLSKLLVGTRILLMIYIGGRKISFSRFLFYNSLPSFIWVLILSLFGVLIARGFESILSIFRNIQLAITFLIIFFIGFYLLQKWINRELRERQKQ